MAGDGTDEGVRGTPLDGIEALAIAREAFPSIFARYAQPGRRETPPFEVKVATG